MSEWVAIIKRETAKLNKKPCVACNEHKVSKITNYKDEKRKFWCMSCISGNYVKCINCKSYRYYGYSSYYQTPYFQCVKCYKSPSLKSD